MYSEARCLGSLVGRKNILHEVSGIGASAATHAAMALCNRGCGGLISFGYAGALRSLYQSGTLVVGHSVSNGFKTIITDPRWIKRFESFLVQEKTITHYNTSFLSSTTPLASKTQKSAHALRGKWGAVDMESYAITEVAAKFSTPVLVIRAILDELDTPLPKGINKMINPKGQLNSAATIFELIKHPSDCRDYLSLAKAKSRADLTLSRVATVLDCCLTEVIPS